MTRREETENWTKGRCWTCKRAYKWWPGKARRLVSMRCPKCGHHLERTSHLYQYGFRELPTEVADLIAAGVYDDYGAGAWK
jgi:DNA-directed RNA polymerase subunit RPC12/RpoP